MAGPLTRRPTGQNYVYHHMCATLGTAAVLMNWEHEKTPDSEEISIIGPSHIPLFLPRRQAS